MTKLIKHKYERGPHVELFLKCTSMKDDLTD